ncbi:hypothetical protein AZC_2388 [Azorhizobium caulinodans ORS 571]|uniref:DUF4337 domain-containing protein n=1 Tax=Azorhizobium caulinodans (strain ATCC 43989 / DSM 5975 / JCM 20966 / LMG 6465 / NBRC 14845 / NCIMB 13405 / ORS 571) TaxID=438753 RepID=A8I6B7_AZOC5|nr:DUF4337 domain-containing protein [Azorhizobium caulinodans]BAF88386.1 hypothetical protein AZC_2388 [Azorhizobium caulinodans ORS 571]
MEVEITSEGHTRALNRAVAMTVVLLSVFMAVAKIKDDNIVQAMQAAKADIVDTWNEYQAARLKLHMNEQTAEILKVQFGEAPPANVVAKLAAIESEKQRYQSRSDKLAQKAKDLEETYNQANMRDDQFDLADAALAISLSLAAVAALTSLWWLLYVSWGFGAYGFFMGTAGFAGWSVHPDWLVALLT